MCCGFYKRFFWVFLGLACLVCLTACNASSTITPTGVPLDIWKINLAPALGWMRPVLNTCALQLTGVTLDVNESDLVEANAINLVWGEPESASEYMVDLGGDTLCLITPAANPVDEISYPNLQSVYHQSLLNWAEIDERASNLGAIEFWQYDSETVLYQQFPQFLTFTSSRQKFLSVPVPSAMQQVVTEHPAALGWVPCRWTDSRVKKIELSQMPSMPARVPVLAVLNQQPGDHQSAWLSCLKEKIDSQP